MPVDIFSTQSRESTWQRNGRWLLGAAMVFAGISHLTFARRAFRKQVPQFVPEILPVSIDQVVVWSGVVEISAGSALLLLPQQRKALGWILASLFIAIFPGNLAQWRHHRSAFGLDTDTKRFLRLLGQPGLVALALWSTGALESGDRPRLGS